MTRHVFLLVMLTAACLSGNALEDAAALQAKGDYLAAVAAYQALLEKDGSQREAHRRLGLCYIMMNRNPEAVATFESYMSLYPDDKSVAEILKIAKNENVVEKTMRQLRKEEARKPDPKPGPWVMAQLELLSPMILGLDLSLFAGKHHNFGVAVSGFANSSSSWMAWHPRYRWYRRQYRGWTFFAGIGALIADYQMGLHGGSRSLSSFRGGDLTIGWAHLRPGIFTQEVYFSFLVGRHTRVERLGEPEEYSGMATYVAPLPGFGFGFAF